MLGRIMDVIRLLHSLWVTHGPRAKPKEQPAFYVIRDEWVRK